jgi:UDP-N-acetylglucosamine 2-epimerase (non-hydrolysing)
MSGAADPSTGELRALAVMGTRPEAIKIAPIVVAAQSSARVRPILLSTGQHRDLQENVLSLFGLRPDMQAEVMVSGQSLAQLSARCLNVFEAFFADARPDVVLVQGDTTSAAMGALAAFYAGIPVWHVEAGLRTSTPRFPFPEEMNRRIITRLASFHLAPTEGARENLLRENVAGADIAVTGNTGIDALLHCAARPEGIGDPVLAGFVAEAERLLVVTIHRRENWGAGVRRVAAAVRDLVTADPGLRVVYAAHPNPAVRRDVVTELGASPRVLVADPLPYGDFVQVLARATVVVTDSGGIQEEAPSLRVPVLVARKETERTEALEAGLTIMVGTDRRAIVREAARLLGDEAARAAMCAAENPYGDGRASERIVALLERVPGGLEQPRAEPPAPIPALANLGG